jgi:RNA recognition motif-containing protein
VPAIPFNLICEYFNMTKLFVGNLPFTTTEESLRELFQQHGTVEKVAVIMDRETGRPRGFAFIEMSTADAARAIQSLNGSSVDGRSIKVNEAQERPSTGGGGGGGSRRY